MDSKDDYLTHAIKSHVALLYADLVMEKKIPVKEAKNIIAQLLLDLSKEYIDE